MSITSETGGPRPSLPFDNSAPCRTNEQMSAEFLVAPSQGRSRGLRSALGRHTLAWF